MPLVVATMSFTAALTAEACTAIVVGKKASATGHVLIGHNEDGTGMYMRHAMLPPGEGKAAVFWSEAKKYAGGDQVGACVYSERGVFVVSNNDGVMQEWDGVTFSLPDNLASENIKSKGPDFGIIGFYQGPRTWKSPYNLYRWKEMYWIAAGVDLEPGAEYPFSVRPAHPVSADDIKRGLRTHYEGRPYEVKERHPPKNPKIIEPICRHTTLQSLVCEMDPNPKETTMHLTVGRPCEVEYGVYRPFSGALPADTVFGEKAVTRLVNHELP